MWGSHSHAWPSAPTSYYNPKGKLLLNFSSATTQDASGTACCLDVSKRLLNSTEASLLQCEPLRTVSDPRRRPTTGRVLLSGLTFWPCFVDAWDTELRVSASQHEICFGGAREPFILTTRDLSVVIYASVLRSFIFCSAARHLSVLENFEDALKVCFGTSWTDIALTVVSTSVSNGFNAVIFWS